MIWYDVFMSHNIQDLKRQFLEYLEIEKGRSLRTVTLYEGYLDRYFDLKKIKSPMDINEDSIREFRLHLNRLPGARHVRGATMSKKSQNYYLIALRVFLKYLGKRKIEAGVSTDYIELAKVPTRQVDIITHNELQRLLEAPLKVKDPVMRARDKAILEMLFSTGLRVSELVALESSIDLSMDEISVRGKGGKVRVVFLSEDAKSAVRDYLKVRKDMSNALFTSLSVRDEGKANKKKENKNEKKNEKKNSKKDSKTEIGFGKPLDRRSVERIVKKYATLAGITERVTPHVIRHCFATDLLRNGADLRSVQALLGHSHIATTQVYTHVTDSHLREIHKKFHGKRN